MSDIVERLRDASLNRDHMRAGWLAEAIDEIERLRARVAELEAELHENEGVIAVWRRRTQEAEAAQEWRPASDEGYKEGKMILAELQAREDDGRLVGKPELALLQWIDGALWEGGQYAIDPDDYILVRWAFAPPPPEVAT